MVNVPLSTGWSKAKDFKKPFYYLCGKGEIPEEQVAEHNPEDGQIVYLRRLDMGDLLKLGIAEEMDVMSKALMTPDTKIPENDQSAKEAVASVVARADNYVKMERMINLVVAGGAIEPRIYEVPEHENARQRGLMYVDEVPWDDRMELFSVIFETDGLSTFREEQEPGVGNVADEPSVPLPADGPVDVRSDDSEGVLLQ